jgi:hypothetical protein
MRPAAGCPATRPAGAVRRCSTLRRRGPAQTGGPEPAAHVQHGRSPWLLAPGGGRTHLCLVRADRWAWGQPQPPVLKPASACPLALPRRPRFPPPNTASSPAQQVGTVVGSLDRSRVGAAPSAEEPSLLAFVAAAMADGAPGMDDMKRDDEPRKEEFKVFVGGLSWQMKDADLKEGACRPRSGGP